MSNAIDTDKTVTVHAPATVANLGPGFDVLGLAIDTPGDTLVVTKTEKPGIVFECDAPGMPAPEKNTGYIAAKEVLTLFASQKSLDSIGNLDWGVHIVLTKGMPVGSGLGSSAATAVGAAVGVNALLQQPFERTALLPACIAAEASVSGSAHADNVAPGLLGGIVLCPPGGQLIQITTALELHLVMYRPEVEVLTAEARAMLPDHVMQSAAIANSASLAQFMYGLAKNDIEIIRGSISDHIAEPYRKTLIPHFDALKTAALAAGALGFSISGSGPTLFALCGDHTSASHVTTALTTTAQRTNANDNTPPTIWTSPINHHGARII